MDNLKAEWESFQEVNKLLKVAADEVEKSVKSCHDIMKDNDHEVMGMITCLEASMRKYISCTDSFMANTVKHQVATKSKTEYSKNHCNIERLKKQQEDMNKVLVKNEEGVATFKK